MEQAKIIMLTAAELESLLDQAAERGAMRALAGNNGNGHADKWLTPEEAAAKFGVTIPWIYRRAKDWKFTRRLSRKNLRISEAGLHRWLEARKTPA